MKTIDGLSLPEAIVRMAIPTFVEFGYEKTSMDEVAARASTTKRTVYAHFGNKEELFRAALARAVELFQADLPELADTAKPAAELERFASTFSALCTWRGAVRLQRVAMGEAERFPDLGGMLHREVIGRAEQRIATYLKALDGTDRPRSGPELDAWALAMASLFLNMATGPRRFATLLEAQPAPADHPKVKAATDLDRTQIRLAVQVFLSGSGLSAR